MKPTDAFSCWIEAPFDALRGIKRGDGGMAALLLAFPLIERMAKARRFNPRVLVQKLFDVSGPIADRFWRVMRDGLAHGFCPDLDRCPGIEFALGTFPCAIAESVPRRLPPPRAAEAMGMSASGSPESIASSAVLRVDPWKVVDVVRAEYEADAVELLADLPFVVDPSSGEWVVR